MLPQKLGQAPVTIENTDSLVNPQMERTAVFVQTHFINSYVKNYFRNLCDNPPEGHDFYILYNCGDDQLALPPEAAELFEQGKIVLTNTAKFLSLGFPQKCRPDGWTGKGWTMVPGNCDLNIVAFFKEHPEYDYYWAIEYDVHFEGQWSFLLNRFKTSRADLLGTTLYRANETPKKILNPPLRDPEGNNFTLEHAVRGFFPICRMSRKGLELIIEEYQKGWDGHQELLLGTILNLHGLTIEDIGGNGDFVKPENHNAFYFNSYKTCSLFPGSFVFRSFSKPLKLKNTLWHPVKPEGEYFKHSPIVKRNIQTDFITFIVKPFISKISLLIWFAFLWRKQN